MESTEILKDGSDINQEIAALAKYLAERGFQDTAEVLSFLSLFLIEITAVSMYNGESKDELLEKVIENFKHFYDREAIEKVINYVYANLENLNGW